MSEIISSGITFTIPSRGEVDWDAVMSTAFTTISGHDHTGSGNGLQLGTTSLSSDSVTDAIIRLRNNQFLRARNNAGSGDVDIIKINASDLMEFSQDINDTHIVLRNNQFLVGRNAADSANINIARVNSSNVVEIIGAVTEAEIQTGAILFGGTSGGSANVHTISLTPALTTYTTGTRVAFIPGTTSDGTAVVTLNIDGLGAQNIHVQDAGANDNVYGGGLISGTIAEVTYDGTNFRLLNPHHALFPSIETGISAAGTVQGDATQLNFGMNEITTIANNSGVRLIPVRLGAMVFVEKHDGTSNTLNIYPASGENIAALAANVSDDVDVDGTTRAYIGLSATHWGRMT